MSIHHYTSSGGRSLNAYDRAHPEATRPVESVPPVEVAPTIGQKIDECLAKISAFRARHESVPKSFVSELKALIAKISS